MRVIDLRSDTVTLPTPGMRDAIARAEVGDDVYGEDPTVQRLEERVATLLGKEAALFFPTGTMANQAALRLHARPGETVLAPRDAHILRFEGGAAAALSGLQIETLGRDGVFDAPTLRGALREGDLHRPRTALVTLENTHNAAGGCVVRPELARELAALARDRGAALHLDGARLFNAAVATGRPAAEHAAPFDTVSVCLSKGLGAPAGSLVAARSDQIETLRRIRKQLGGAMRQVGFLAAAGLYALEHHVERLREDHDTARRLAAGLRTLGCAVEGEPESNMVMFCAAPTGAFLAASRARGVLINALDGERLRAVTHLDVDRRAIDEALTRLADCFAEAGGNTVSSDPAAKSPGPPPAATA